MSTKMVSSLDIHKKSIHSRKVSSLDIHKKSIHSRIEISSMLIIPTRVAERKQIKDVNIKDNQLI